MEHELLGVCVQMADRTRPTSHAATRPARACEEAHAEPDACLPRSRWRPCATGAIEDFKSSMEFLKTSTCDGLETSFPSLARSCATRPGGGIGTIREGLHPICSANKMLRARRVA